MMEIVVSFLASACAGSNFAKGIYRWMDGDKTGAFMGFDFCAIYAGIVMF